MQQHELRVVEEKTQLDERLEKLVKFTCSEMFTSLGDTEQDLMILQQNLMMQLSHVLGCRIKAFGKK